MSRSITLHFKITLILEFADWARHFALLGMSIKIYLLRLSSIAIAIFGFLIAIVNVPILLHFLLYIS